MKRYCVLAVLLSLIGLQAVAQNGKRVAVVIKMGKIEGPEVVDGKVTAINTTRTEIMKNAWLVSTASNCEITSFSFSIKAEGHTLTGPFPVKGAVLTEKIKEKIRQWDYPHSQIIIKDIHITCGGNDHIAYPLFLNYDE